MSWIENVERLFDYGCKKCGTQCELSMATVDHQSFEPAGFPCLGCGETGQLEYLGFRNPAPILSQKVVTTSFDQNGRKARKIGNQYLSETKINYLETGKIENKYTKEYERKMNADKVKNEVYLNTETNKRRAIVKSAKGSNT